MNIEHLKETAKSSTAATVAVTIIAVAIFQAAGTDIWDGISGAVAHAQDAPAKLSQLDHRLTKASEKADANRLQVALTTKTVTQLHESQAAISQRSIRLEQKMDRMLELMIER